MLKEKEIKKLLSELVHADVAQIHLNGFAITVNIYNQGSKIFLSTPVYFGGNYIPKSVRSCLSRKAPFDRLSIRTNLEVDEENYLVNLKHVGTIAPTSQQRFIDLLKDFSWLAEMWHDYLDEHDKNDLIHVPVS